MGPKEALTLPRRLLSYYLCLLPNGRSLSTAVSFEYLYVLMFLQLSLVCGPIHTLKGLQQPEPGDFHDWSVGSHEFGLQNGNGSNGEPIPVRVPNELSRFCCFFRFAVFVTLRLQTDWSLPCVGVDCDYEYTTRMDVVRKLKIKN